jgi:outer membrane assembly lipoprotein YfiO
VGLATLLGLALAGGACSRGFQVRRYEDSQSLFVAALAEFNKGKWANAIQGFEKLTLDLSPRDTLLPPSHWYLARAHEGQREHILAATSYVRLAESFPDDSLADDALLAAGNAYARMWRHPGLDPTYANLGQTQFQALISIYPDSPLRPTAEAALRALDEKFAEKDYLTGRQYERRGAFDSAIIYYKDVVKRHPDTDHARLAMIQLVGVYRRPQLNYREEAAELCATLRAAYAGDPQVARVCPSPAAADTGKAAAPTVRRPVPGAPAGPSLPR